jgi:glycolate oxidase FAD binding subunit
MEIYLTLNWIGFDMQTIGELQKKVRHASQLRIVNSDDESSGELLNMKSYSGVIDYYPEELVITVKAGTVIEDINQVLEENKQALPFYISDPKKTIGSLYATAGSDLSDSVLGIQIINGKGDLLNFGGQVMKNVAGYDVSRLLVGSMGSLAVITQISFKVFPEKMAHERRIKIEKKNDHSPLRKQIEKKLKDVFDPYGVFV